MLGIRERFLSIFYVNLLDLDLSNVVFALLSLQLSLFFLQKLLCVLYFTLFVRNFDLDQTVLRASLLIFLLKSFLSNGQLLLG